MGHINYSSIITYSKGRRDEMKLPLNPSVIHPVIRLSIHYMQLREGFFVVGGGFVRVTSMCPVVHPDGCSYLIPTI